MTGGEIEALVWRLQCTDTGVVVPLQLNVSFNSKIRSSIALKKKGGQGVAGTYGSKNFKIEQEASRLRSKSLISRQTSSKIHDLKEGKKTTNRNHSNNQCASSNIKYLRAAPGKLEGREAASPSVLPR